MRIRLDFVTNSSDSSFIMSLKDLNATQIYAIKNHTMFAEHMGWGKEFNCDYGWGIEVNKEKGTIEGYTSMDNFDMYEFVRRIGIAIDKVKWEGSNM